MKNNNDNETSTKQSSTFKLIAYPPATRHVQILCLAVCKKKTQMLKRWVEQERGGRAENPWFIVLSCVPTLSLTYHNGDNFRVNSCEVIKWSKFGAVNSYYLVQVKLLSGPRWFSTYIYRGFRRFLFSYHFFVSNYLPIF